MATGLDARMLRAMAKASAATADARRRKNADKAVTAARRELAAVLAEAMAASCPPGAAGYGGQLSVQGWKMAKDAVVEVRSAMRKAGRSLGWTVHTYAYDYREVTWVAVTDERDVPARVERAVRRARDSEMIDAMEMLRGEVDRGEGRERPAKPEHGAGLQAFNSKLKTLLDVICG